MASQGSRINASEYNSIQTTIAGVLGTLYGQTVNSSQIPTPSPTSITKINATQWQALYQDILTCYNHQNSTAGSLTWPTTSTKIAYSDLSAYQTMATNCSTNYLNFNSTYFQTSTPVSDSYGTSGSNNWGLNGSTETLQETISLQFASSANSGYYFNSGGQIRFSASLTGGQSGSAGTKDYSWASMLSHMGTLVIGANSTAVLNQNLSGQTQNTLATTTGYNQLTSTPTLLYQVISSSYNPNQVDIYGSVSGNTLTLVIKYEDQSGQPNPPWGTDEYVTGVVNNTVTLYYAYGGPTSPNVATQMSVGSATYGGADYRPTVSDHTFGTLPNT
jgi:hypothetical protein